MSRSLFALLLCSACAAAQAGPVSPLLGALSGGEGAAMPSQQSSSGAISLLGAPVLGQTLAQPLAGLAAGSEATADGLLGLSVFETGPDGSGYPVLAEINGSPITQPLANTQVGDLLGLGGEANLIDIALLGGNGVGNAASGDGLLGAAVLSGSNVGQGGLIGLGVLNDDATGVGSLLGLAALSGHDAGQGGAIGIGILNKSRSGNADMLAIGALSGRDSGQASEGLGIGLLNRGDALHIMFGGDVVLSLAGVSGQLADALPIGEVVPGIWIGGGNVTSANPLLNVGVLAGDNAGSGGLIGLAVLSGDNAAQGDLIGLGVLNGDGSAATDGGIGIAALSGDGSATGALGVGVLNGDGSANGDLIGAGVLSGDNNANGGVLGAGVLNGDNSGNGDTLGAAVLSGDGAGNGGAIGAGVLNGGGSGNGGTLGAGALNGPDSGGSDGIAIGALNPAGPGNGDNGGDGGDNNGGDNGNAGGDGDNGNAGGDGNDSGMDVARNAEDGSSGDDVLSAAERTDMLCALVRDNGSALSEQCNDRSNTGA